MKKILFLFCMSTAAINVFGAGTEKTCFFTSGGPICRPQNFGYVEPCSKVAFQADQLIPTSTFPLFGKLNGL